MKGNVTERLLRKVKRTIDQYHLLEKDDRLIVGVSGGIDSMVLLYILNTLRQKYNLSIIVAHLNHGLRPEEAYQEASLVRKETEKFGFPFEYDEADVKGFQKSKGLSIQDAARRIRFQFFERLLVKYNANRIVLGHNADDQVETIILRILRGAGLKGLRGMLPIRDGKIIRPLIEVWRKDIETFAKENNIPFLLDSSNLKRDYLRNRIRLDLIPLIENEYQPKFKEILLKTAEILRQESEYIDGEAEKIYKDIVKKENNCISFRISDYQPLNITIKWRLLQKILKEILPEGDFIKDYLNPYHVLKRLNKPSNIMFKIEEGIYVKKNYDKILIGKGQVSETPPFEIELNSPGKVYIKEIGRELIIEEIYMADRFISDSKNIAFLDYDKLQFPLRIRNFRPGDRFQPLGLNGIQKLKKFFIDHKIPRFERYKIPLVVSGKIIAWVAGYRIDERVKVTKETKRVIKAELI